MGILSLSYISGLQGNLDMNITYIVGNGLDLQYGLKTRYRDFYDYQNKLYSDRKAKEGYLNFIYESLFADEVNEYKNWSDFELSIGNLTKENSEIIVSEETKNKFIDDFTDVIDDLIAYLKMVEKNFNIENYKIDFEGTLNRIRADLPLSNQEIISKKYSDKPGESDYVKILSLNYTGILDKLYESSTVSFNNSQRNNAYSFRISEPIHVHGILDACTILGVSDESQISDAFSDEQKGFLVKESMLKEYRENMDVRNSEIIKNSDIIILYGVSIGFTDKYLWNQIAKRSIDDEVPVIVYHYVPKFNRGNPIRMRHLYEKVEEKFIKISGIDSEFEKKLRGNLIPVIGKSIFELIER